MAGPLTRRRLLQTLGGATASLLSVRKGLANPPRAKKPNVVLIMADDLGYECLGCHGSKQYRTSRLDRLAAEGMRFSHCYATPLCTPSRIEIMTGIYNHRNYVRFSLLPKGEKTFGHLMRQAGYRTAIVGKWQLGKQNPPDQAGFDEYCLFNFGPKTPGSHERYWHAAISATGKALATSKTDYGPDHFAKYIEGFLERNRERPFFVYYPMGLPHAPFDATPDSKDPSVRNDAKAYPDMVAYTDKIVGRIVDKLAALGLREKTLVLFTTDNGTPGGITSEWNGKAMRGGKARLTDAGTRVPLVASWPTVMPKGKVCEDLVDFTDFLATLADLAGMKKPPGTDGVSFLPQLQGRKAASRKWAFTYFKGKLNPSTGQMGPRGGYWARDRRWKLYHDGRLFDMQADPEEHKPIKPPQDTPAAADARQRLSAVFRQLQVTTRGLYQNELKRNPPKRRPRQRPGKATDP